MKPLLILTAGCTPLAVLTVLSFAGLGEVDRQLPTAGFESRALADDFSTVAVERQVAADQGVCKAMAGRRLLEGDALLLPKDALQPEYLSDCVEHWAAWRRAYELAADVLAAEHDAQSTDVEQLRRTVNRFAELKHTAQKQSPVGVERLLRTLDQRGSELNREIRRLELRKEAMAVLRRSRDAFQQQRYGDCLLLCDELTETYSDALDEADLTRLDVLRTRAVFWHDVQRLFADLKRMESLTHQQSRLRAFLGTYADQGTRTATERTLLDDCRRRLAEVEGVVLNQQRNSDARPLLDALRSDPPETFTQRLARSTALLASYPSPEVRSELQAMVHGWVAAMVPPKRLDEPAELEEVSTSDGRVLRGFFQRVPRQGEPLIGYKRYATPEDRLNPRVTVGTYRTGQLGGVPGPTLARQCLRRYEQARRRLLAHPQRRESWEQLASACEAIEAELRIYRAKAGAKPLSFAAQGQFAREVLRGTAWTELEALFRP